MIHQKRSSKTEQRLDGQECHLLATLNRTPRQKRPELIARLAHRMARHVAGAGEGKRTMIRWYQQRAHAWLPRRIRPWAQRMNVQPGDLDVRDLGYRWGSLGKDNRFNIHWAAMQLPVSLVDYVIVHELVHIGQPRHTPAFWATVQRALPNPDQRRTRLATAGTTLARLAKGCAA